ncbi:MAG: hypothetical protein EZS28_017871 [Streblomastix strix]|uniref:Uncharacterized protein n=1 Tax=Streblomastix strix TaxID=222440 RepID=A0A5J4VW95_9EUKA|nr:MAG: hypothetical protein EZS28_017871 [Streblomastix strix]
MIDSTDGLSNTSHDINSDKQNAIHNEADTDTNIELNKKIKELQDQVRILETEKEKEQQEKQIEKRRSDQLFERLKQNNEQFDYFLKCLGTQRKSLNIKRSEWVEMNNGLKQEEKGNEDQKNLIRRKKIEVCQNIVLKLLGVQNESSRIIAIEVGIIDSLIWIFASYPIEQIQPIHIWSFFTFTNQIGDETNQLIFNKKPYPQLLRLLDHPFTEVIDRSICGGIDKIFSLFQRNISKYSKDRACFCLGLLYKGQELPQSMNSLIAYLKLLLKDDTEWVNSNARIVLQFLSLNAVNRLEIDNPVIKVVVH